ncbi:hypothetical protein BJY04DRAFT_202028 [Aspergillus karnatakaensis]|uniref:uncharacterized protein n=1 Tax=Aspergillus karnatakaensis TaxID=1810916 RepID=UPI003CCCE868
MLQPQKMGQMHRASRGLRCLGSVCAACRARRPSPLLLPRFTSILQLGSPQIHSSLLLLLLLFKFIVNQEPCPSLSLSPSSSFNSPYPAPPSLPG